MSRIGPVDGSFDRADVASVICRLLAQQSNAASLQPGPEALAGQLARLTAERQAGLVGASGQWPQKIVVAAVALAEGYRRLGEPELQRALTVALSNVLAEIEVNAGESLTAWERQLVAEVTGAFSEMLAAYNKAALAG